MKYSFFGCWNQLQKKNEEKKRFANFAVKFDQINFNFIPVLYGVFMQKNQFKISY